MQASRLHQSVHAAPITVVHVRGSFTGALYVSLGVLDTIGMTAFYAAPLIGSSPLLSCPFDVFDLCEVDIIPSEMVVGSPLGKKVAEDAEHLPRGVPEPSRPEGGPVRLSGDLGAFVCLLFVC